MNDSLFSLEVLFAPAEFAALSRSDLSDTVCVVFDIFRATSTIVTALAHGAGAIIPVGDIPEALQLHQQNPDVLLAGERGGLRITSELTGSRDFDLGNSPREFVPQSVRGRTIVLTTTNGSRALKACAGAKAVLVGSFLNLTATANHLRTLSAGRVLLVCSGTGEQTAYEDVLGAGALASLLAQSGQPQFTDSASLALQIYERNQPDLAASVNYSVNGQRLLAMPGLRGDVHWCLQRDTFPLVATMRDGGIIKLPSRPAVPAKPKTTPPA